MKFDIRIAQKVFMMVVLLALCLACGKTPIPESSGEKGDDDVDNSDNSTEQTEDIEVVDGKVRFYPSDHTPVYVEFKL